MTTLPVKRSVRAYIACRLAAALDELDPGLLDRSTRE
jgi:hypothetical protein